MRGSGTLLIAVALTLGARSARAEDVVGTRALGMGGALRAAATGSAGIHLNPSGMTLIKGYVMEASYGYRGQDSLSAVDASIVDTLTSNLGAGLFLSYLTASPRSPTVYPDLAPPGEKLDRSGYQAGLALSLPFMEFLHIGLTGKYVDYETRTKHPLLTNTTVDKTGDFTMDAGATVRLGGLVNLAIVGQNFIDTHSREAPVTLGCGVALTAIESLVVDFDASFDFSSFKDGSGQGRTVARYAIGAELFALGLALRGGYLNDRGARVGAAGTAVPLQFASFGLSLVGKGAALDAGLRQQLSGAGEHETLFNIGLRFFVQ